MKILSVIGTRPEAIKMAPVLKALAKNKGFKNWICLTSQHREMLEQVLDLFDIEPHFNLNIMKSGQDLFDVTTNVLKGLKKVLKEVMPDMVLVQGDTTTTFSASLAAYFYQMKVGHIEAGLRTYKRYAPFPEEMNRQITSCLADIHFTPTERAKQNLLKENVPEKTIYITGNTAIDALFMGLKKIKEHSSKKTWKLNIKPANIPPALSAEGEHSNRRLILVTGHRRENFGRGIENICYGLKTLAKRNDIDILYPVHMNPNVQRPVMHILGNSPNIYLTEPLDYLSFVYLMDKSYLIITDSGGIQEEAPSLGKPVLVMREVTERQEAVEAGTVKLVGTDRKKIVTSANQLLDDPAEYAKMSFAHNPYGDGRAAERIVNILSNYH